MSMTKNQFHEEINPERRGMGIQWEPYMFKYVAKFNYEGQAHTLFADSLSGLQTLAADIFNEPVQINFDKVAGCEFILQDLHIPFLLIDVVNPRYY